jgi:hypothetical protein
MPGGMMRDTLGGVALRTQNFSPDAVRSGGPLTSPLVPGSPPTCSACSA